MKLLLVEDNEQLNKALSTILKRNLYIVDSALDGLEALDLINEYSYDIIILDVMLPKIDGFEILKILRNNKNNTPVIMLTAKSSVDDKVKGLDLGADDYLSKPFQTAELLSRIRALSRRSGKIIENEIIVYQDLKLDASSLELSSGENKIILMNKEMQIMSMLMKAQGKLVSLENIVNGAWDISSYSTNENVWTFISYLRKKLEKINSKTKIKSIRYQGYYLN